MRQGYLIVSSERRVLNVMLGDELDAIEHVLGCTAIEHGTTLHTEDQFLTAADELDRATSDLFHVVGVPFPFSGNGLLVGIDSATGDIADRPKMTIDEFQRSIVFPGRAGKQRTRISIRGD
jgi:hypothetical protein